MFINFERVGKLVEFGKTSHVKHKILQIIRVNFEKIKLSHDYAAYAVTLSKEDIYQ